MARTPGLAALHSVYRYRGDRQLRLAAIGGLVAAFLGRSTVGIALVGGFAGLLTIFIGLQANLLLSAQNDRMDVQTIAMIDQRRTQIFQAELAALAADLPGDLARISHATN